MSIASRIRHYLRRRRANKSGTRTDAHQLDAELQFHLDQQTADFIAEGLSPAEARRRAALQLGSAVAIKEASRDTRWETHLEHFAQDLKFATRVLAKSTRSTILAVCALALGIGSSTIIFTVMYTYSASTKSSPSANAITPSKISSPTPTGSSSIRTMASTNRSTAPPCQTTPSTSSACRPSQAAA
jgi:hypothetical protein